MPSSDPAVGSQQGNALWADASYTGRHFTFSTNYNDFSPNFCTQLGFVNRIDIPRLQQQSPEPLAPVYLQLQSAQPKDSDFLRLLPLPATDEGPHLSYAIQWFIFATVGAVGWPLLLRKQGRDIAAEGGPEAAKGVE